MYFSARFVDAFTVEPLKASLSVVVIFIIFCLFIFTVEAMRSQLILGSKCDTRSMVNLTIWQCRNEDLNLILEVKLDMLGLQK